MAAVTDRVEIAGVAVSPDHYIGGRRVASRHRFEVRSAVDGAHLADVAAGAAGRGRRRPWPRRGARSRPGATSARRAATSRCCALADAITRRVPEHRRGRVDQQRLARYEAMRERVIRRGAHNIDFFAEAALQPRQGETYEHSTGTATSRVRYEPSGVAALITPWNAPFMLATWRVGPALAAGYTVVLKPPEWAPLTCSLLADLAEEAGARRPACSTSCRASAHEAGAALVCAPRRRPHRVHGLAWRPPQSIAARRRREPHAVSLRARRQVAVHRLRRRRPRRGRRDGRRPVRQRRPGLPGGHAAARRARRSSTSSCARFLGAARGLAHRRARVRRRPRVGPLITRTHLERVAGFVERARARGRRPALGGRRVGPR